MSPFVIVPAAIVAGGVGIYEGGCYLSERKKKEAAPIPPKQEKPRH